MSAHDYLDGENKQDIKVSDEAKVISTHVNISGSCYLPIKTLHGLPIGITLKGKDNSAKSRLRIEFRTPVSPGLTICLPVYSPSNITILEGVCTPEDVQRALMFIIECEPGDSAPFKSKPGYDDMETLIAVQSFFKDCDDKHIEVESNTCTVCSDKEVSSTISCCDTPLCYQCAHKLRMKALDELEEEDMDYNDYYSDEALVSCQECRSKNSFFVPGIGVNEE